MNNAELLRFLVEVPSVSGNEAALADLLSQRLDEDGFRVEREANNLWFTLGVSGGPHLVLLSHIDTVPPAEGWTGDPFKLRLEEGRLIGLGANDAKGCVAAMILAARELREEKVEDAITFAFVAEEERGGDGVRAVKPKLGRIDAAIIGEPTALQVCTAQRGMLILRCTAHGESAHAAHAHLGENAIHKAARDIARLSAMALGASPQVTQISGGLARNQVPDRCEFFVDIRTTPKVEHDALVAEIEAALESEVVVHSKRYEPVATDESEMIVRAALQSANASAGVGSETTSDWAFLKGIPAVKAGPGDTRRSHRPNEYLLESELAAGAAFYAATVREYFALAAREVVHA